MSDANRPEGADATRNAILEAAARRLHEHGADGLRLAQIAEDVGITHPLILHYFGSKRGLMEALLDRIAQTLNDEVAAFIPWQNSAGQEGAPKIEAVFRVLSDRGIGRLIAWAVQQGNTRVIETVGATVTRMRDAMIEFKAQQDGAPPDQMWIDQLSWWLRLPYLAGVGEGVAGPTVPLDDAERRDFRLRLGNLIEQTIGI